VAGRVVVEEVHLRLRTLDLVEQLLSLLEVGRRRQVVLLEDVEARHSLGSHVRGRDLARLRDVLDHRRPVDSERHGLPLVDVGDVGQVEAVVVRREVRDDGPLLRLLETVDLLRRLTAVVQAGVDFAVLEGLESRDRVGDHARLDPRERDVAGVAPLVPLLERERGVVLPVRELERAARDDVLRVRPGVSELLDGRLVNRQERLMRGLGDEPRLR
jgi:hypothetical protein